MPLYEYRCRKCGHEELRFRSIRNRDLVVGCEYCDSLALRVVSAPHLHGSPNMPNG